MQPGVSKDRLISALTWGPFVHTEIWLDRGDGSRPRTYASLQGVSGFTPSVVTGAPHEWEVLRYQLSPPATGYEKTYAWLLQLIALNLAYNSKDLWQCCVQIALPFEKDLDCERPESWGRHGGVFCSQAALLILRRMARAGLISLPDHQKQMIERTNSRGCSPNSLFRILNPP